MLRNRFLFYLLSLTWGLPMTLIGCIVAVILLIAGYKPKKFGYCYYFEVGNNGSGTELGMFFLVSQNTSMYLKTHELGHGLQNCIYGPLMPFIICIPSAVRYRYRQFKYHRKGKNPPTDYYSIWFEKDASMRGEEFMIWYDTKHPYNNK